MNEELSAFQTKVNAIIYNPFVNLKDHTRALKQHLSEKGNFAAEIAKLDTAISELDKFEDLPYGNLERIKGFNKVKSHILRVIKEIATSQS